MEPAPEQAALKASRPKLSPTARNIFYNWVAFFVASIVAFFLSPFIVRHLGDSGYGIWTLSISLTGYLGLLDLGVRAAVTRFVAKFHAQAADENASRVVSSALTLFLAAGAIAIVFTVGIALSVVDSLRIPAIYQLAAKVVLILTGINIAVSLVSGVFSGVVVALQRFDLSNGLEIISTLIRTMAIVFVLSHGGGLISLALVQLSFSILTGLGYLDIAFQLYPQLKIHLSGCDKENIKLIFSFSLYAFFLQAATYLIFYVDSLVISAFLPVSAVTFFAIAGNLMSYSRGFLSGISTTSAPLASVMEAKGNMNELSRVLLKGSRLASMAFLPIGISFLIRGRSFIGLWMGPSYAALSGEVLVILTLAQLILAGNYVPTSMTIGIARHRGIVPAILLEGLCNLGLSTALVRSHGIVGVALGTALPNLAMHLFFWPWYIQRVYGIRPMTYAFSTWVRPGLAALPYAFCTYVVEKWWPATNVFMFFLQTALVLPTVLASFWFFCVTRQERSDYSQRFLGHRLGTNESA